MTQAPDNFGAPRSAAPPPLPVASILDYRTPRPVESLPGSRARAIGKGIRPVWLVPGLVAGVIFLSHGSAQLVWGTLVLGGILCITLAAFDSAKKNHAGLFVGLILGVVSVIGVAFLAITILCGWWR